MKLTLMLASIMTALVLALNSSTMVTSAWSLGLLSPDNNEVDVGSGSGDYMPATTEQPGESIVTEASGLPPEPTEALDKRPAIIDDQTNMIVEVDEDTSELDEEKKLINVLFDIKKSLNSPNAFPCKNGRFIPGYYRCDGFDDCFDNSDEKNCHKVTCNDDEYRCSTGQCIPTPLKCDGRIDCPHGTDEDDC